MDPKVLRMLTVGSIPQCVLKLEPLGEQDGDASNKGQDSAARRAIEKADEACGEEPEPALKVARQLESKGGIAFCEGEAPIFLINNFLKQDVNAALGLQARHCVILTERRVLKVENWQVTQVIKLGDVVFAENKGESTFTALTKVLVGLFDGRQEVIHLHERSAAQWLCSLMGRIGHLNERRERKNSTQADHKKDPGTKQASRTPRPVAAATGPDKSRRRKFRVLIRRSAKWEHAVVILEPDEIRIVKLIPADPQKQKSCKRINGRILQKWDEVPIRTRR